MNRIRLLPEQVANQIAAGEVIERPASVVKELVENALDARAGRISVEIQAGGRSLIRVTDDGSGMSRDDALLCFERHATSKIQRAEDLAAITTMGFRGEALPSIASVSRLTLTTRERESESVEGTQVLISGGRIQQVRAASSALGTTVEVRQLFFNLPARRKFLRSEETERAHIQHYLMLAALAFPSVGVTFTNEQRLVWQLPPVAASDAASAPLPALHERLRALYGGDLNLLAVDYTVEWDEPAWAEEAGAKQDGDPAADSRSPGLTGASDGQGGLHVWGFIGAPGVSRATREDQHLFVNRRPVENRGLNFALLEGYHTALMKGRYPVCCLFLELDPASVDVNIHPSKREVKFHAERRVRAAVTQAIRQALLAYHTSSHKPVGCAPSAGTGALDRPGAESVVEAPPPIPELPHLGSTTPASAPEPVLAKTQPSRALPDRPSAPPSPAPVVELAKPGHTTRPFSTEATPAPQSPGPAIPSSGAVPLLNVPLRLVGVIGRLYVVFESDRGLVLLDQHAAHERVLYEQMLNRLEQGPAPSQRLLLPETVELAPRDALFLREQLPVLTRLGIGLSEFGERTFLLDSLPPFVKVTNPRGFVVELIDGLKASGQEVNTLRLGEQMIAKTVCRHAVKANDALQGRELEKLVEDLRHCVMPYTCPHGRPTLIELSYRELERKFGRAQ